MLRAVHYDEEVAIARALIAHLHLQAKTGAAGSSSYYLGKEGESPSSFTTNLDVPEGTGAVAAGGVVTGSRYGGDDQKPGEFVRKKKTEEEVLVPATWTMVKRRSKREKRRSAVSFLSLSPTGIMDFFSF